MKQLFKYLPLILIVLSQRTLAFGSDNSLWRIKADSINEQHYFGEMVANGMIGMTSSSKPLCMEQVILAGVYDKFGRGRVNNFLPSFNPLDIEMMVNGVRVDRHAVTNYAQELDMRRGIFKGNFKIPNVADVSYQYRALRNLPHNVMLTVSIRMIHGGGIAVDNRIQTPAALKNDQHYFNQVETPKGLISLLTSVAETPSKSTTIAASSAFLFPEPIADRPLVTHHMKDNDSHQATFIKELDKGDVYEFSIVGSLFSSVQIADPYNQVERSTLFALLEGEELLKSRHDSAWNKLWRSDIIIEGDDEAQRVIRSMLYHLYATMRENVDYSPSPMGLSGVGYNGHVFWDSEIFMFPPLLYLQPQLAKSMLNYRFNRLEAAKRSAAISGYDGAMFPWESASTGGEETPVWALTGPFEHHVTAAVGIAAWNYYLVTQDLNWLKNRGWPLLENTAKFWASRVVKNDQGEYVINNVVAADEWAENIDNDAYTNGAAKRNLEFAIAAAKLLNIEITDQWGVIASKIPIRSMQNGVTSEYDGYDGRAIKQADVNLLAYPLKVITEREQIERDLDYYAARVPQFNTPAMTQAIFALLYSRLGKSKEAYFWFKDAFEENMCPPFGVLAETKKGDNPYFLTGAGGVLQTVLMGFCGLDIGDNGELFQHNSVMPSHWKRITVTGVGKDKKVFVRE